MSEAIRDVIVKLSECVDNSSPPWAAYHTIMGFHLVSLDKRLWVRPMGIGETLIRALANILMREAGVQANMSYGKLHLCAKIESGIEEATHDVGQRQIDRGERGDRGERDSEGGGEYTEEEAEYHNEEDTRVGVFTVDVVRTEGEAAEILEAALGMEVEGR